jgi:hypothetical protein
VTEALLPYLTALSTRLEIARRDVHRPRLERTDSAPSRLRLRAGVPGASSASRLCRLTRGDLPITRCLASALNERRSRIEPAIG